MFPVLYDGPAPLVYRVVASIFKAVLLKNFDSASTVSHSEGWIFEVRHGRSQAGSQALRYDRRLQWL